MSAEYYFTKICECKISNFNLGKSRNRAQFLPKSAFILRGNETLVVAVGCMKEVETGHL